MRDTDDLYEALKKTAARFNDTQCEEEMIVGQILEGDDAANFIRYLMNAGKAVQGGG